MPQPATNDGTRVVTRRTHFPATGERSKLIFEPDVVHDDKPPWPGSEHLGEVVRRLTDVGERLRQGGRYLTNKIVDSFRQGLSPNVTSHRPPVDSATEAPRPPAVHTYHPGNGGLAEPAGTM